MKSFKMAFAIVSLLNLLDAHASETNHSRRSHNVETKFAFGNISNEILDLNTRYVELSYNYELKNRMYVGVGLLHGDSDVLLSANSLFSHSEIKVGATKLILGYKYRTTLKHQLYVEISLGSYEVQLSGIESVDETLRDYGVGYSTGWR